MNIQPVVEGYGDVSAAPVLLRRLRDESGIYDLEVNRPIRRNRSELISESALRKVVQLARLQPACGAILILFDGDDDCPKELAPQLQQWAQSEAGAIPCAVVIAQREYESWFLAAIESLRGKRGIRTDAESHPDPELPRGAKERLEDCLETGRSYAETADQAALTAIFDLAVTYTRCRSFKRMVRAFGLLVVGMGFPLQEWPPAAWQKIL